MNIIVASADIGTDVPGSVAALMSFPSVGGKQEHLLAKVRSQQDLGRKNATNLPKTK